VHRRQLSEWERLPSIVGLESAQQFWDHVAFTPGQPSAINSTCILKGRAGEPEEPGFSRTVHYEISSSGRIDFQYHDSYTGGAQGDPHPVVRIRAINLSSH
jgi:hypothetical protein